MMGEALHVDYRPSRAHLTLVDGLVAADNHNQLIQRVARLRQVRIQQAKDDFNAFVEYAFTSGSHAAPFRQAWFHEEWARAMTQHERCLIVAPRDHGKCVPDDALVPLDDGTRCRAVDLPENFRTRTWQEDCGWVDRDARKWQSLTQPIIEMRTRAGRSLRVSEEHPMWTQRGWVPARDVRVGDFIGCARGMPCGDVDESPDRAFLLGALLGDGGLTQPSRIGITIGNAGLLEEIRIAAHACRWKVGKQRGTDYDYRVTGGPGAYAAPIRYVRRLGLHGTGAHGKHVPAEVFSWTRKAVAALVAGYLETDGTVTDGEAGRIVEFYSVSRRLLADVQSLLLRLNVWSRLAPKNGRYKGAPHHSWRLLVGGAAIDDLAAALPRRGPKCRALHDLRQRVKSSGVDLIPDGLLDRLLPERFTREAPRLDNRRKDGHQRWKVEARARRKLDVGLRLLRNVGLCWDAVVAVREQPPERTWSIEVPGVGTIIVDDAVTHNTTQVVARVLWELGRNPDLRVKIACASDGRAKERLFEVVQHIQSNRRLWEVFPNLMPAESGEWSKHKVVVQRRAMHRDASVEAIGITSTATGGRADLLVADDVVDRRNALSFPALRTIIKQAWRSDWTNLLEPGARVWYICTLWHKDDLSHDLMTNPEYRTSFYAVGDDFGALWPDKWNEESLRQRHREIGTVEFNRAFRNQAVDTESAVVQPNWIRFADLRTDALFRERIEHMAFVTSYDTAGTPVAGKDPDYAAGVILAVDQERRHVYVLDAWHARISVAAQAERIFAEAQRYKPVRILIEKVGQATVDEWLLREHPELIGVVQVTKPRVSKHQRLLGVTPLLEAGHVTFNTALNPNATGWSAERGALVHELEDFPFAKNDDLVDAFSQALTGARDQILDAELNEPEILFNVGGPEEADGYLW